MRIKNISGEKKHFSWIGKLGATLDVNEEKDISDAYALNQGYLDSRDAGDIGVVSYETTPDSLVLQDEAPEIIESVVDGNKLDIALIPDNYTRTPTAEAPDEEDLTAHLKGIDVILGTAPPGGHKESHVGSGLDLLDGDKIDISWNPSNYTPDATPGEADDVDDLTAHLKGVDDKLATIGAPTYVFRGEGLLQVVSTLDPVAARKAFTIAKVKLLREKAGSSGTTEVDILKNGVSIFPTTPKPSVVFGAGDDAISSAVPDTTAVAEDDVLAMSITQIEGGEPYNVTVEVY